MRIVIDIKNKVAERQNDVSIVCGNSDYVIQFTFDAEWAPYETKTARFVTDTGYTDVVFSGDEVAVPVITDAISVRVGVYAGNLRTTTPAVIFCRRCITDGSGGPVEPTPDVYAQIMERLNNLDGATPATADKLGVVKIGDNLKITEDGVLSVDTAEALDTTLTQSGKAADAAVVGERLDSLSEEKVSKSAITLGVNEADGLVYIFIGGQPVGNGVSISGGTVEDDITVVDGTMTILALANTPTQNDTTLMIA